MDSVITKILTTGDVRTPEAIEINIAKTISDSAEPWLTATEN